MKKKFVFTATAIALMFPLITTTVSAKNIANSYTDNNSDGICDNRGTNSQNQGFIDEDSDGICDNRVANSQGQGFVDKDGDGICDNRNGAVGQQGQGIHTCAQDGTGNGTMGLGRRSRKNMK